MPHGLASLAWELLISIVSYLNLQDFINLKTARLNLFRLLDSESISREIVKVQTPTSPLMIDRHD